MTSFIDQQTFILAAFSGLILLGSVVWSLFRRRPSSTEGEAQASEGLELVRLIAEGGMGGVYEARDPILHRRVAVKRMRPEIRGDPASKAKLLKEARIVAGLHHPNIVDIYSVVDTPDELYLVFEYIDGKTIGEILRARGRIPLEECARIVHQVCSALACAHSKHVLHRDLKPSNIMVDAHDMVKVMDFGIARQAKSSMTTLTGGKISGTLSYMSPEQHLGEERLPADIYALGVTLYEMLAGRLPFDGPPREYLRQKEGMQFSPLSGVAAGLGPDADAFMGKCLAADPNRRFAAVPEFLAAFKEAFPS